MKKGHGFTEGEEFITRDGLNVINSSNTKKGNCIAKLFL
jgi:hypothetical protein